ncbi:hypothetical protein K431DRAFT_345977 [Polychaeton citri CBS 116435]|uniref:Uncharacterized protein n=1 Tax=Polychaeton citri CBS 116435 TaxID=1314669 RepID=A0A9P4Q7G0_9PEZI|nr:hypothetical protein K431DRAFT_345977 [Polychaeton citri CBS 116435]
MASSELTCYTVGWNFVSSTNQYFPCGSVNSDSSNSTQAQACCYAGHDYSICHYDHHVEGGTGYYMAGCTDPTWQDPACATQCTSEYGADIVYDSAANQWQCCDVTNTTKNCDNPTNDFVIKAPAPSLLSTQEEITATVPPAEVTGIGSIPGPSPFVDDSNDTSLSSSSSSSSSPSSTKISSFSSSSVSPSSTRAAVTSLSSTSLVAMPGSATPSTEAAASTSSETSSPTSLSTGAKAGIAIGIIVGVLLIAGATNL